jgi:hypothetical protein
VDVGERGSGNCGRETVVVPRFGPGGGAAWSTREGKRHLPFCLVAQGGKVVARIGLTACTRGGGEVVGGDGGQVRTQGRGVAGFMLSALARHVW